MNKYTLVLDAGHGLPDVGAIGFSVTHEATINLKVVKIIGRHVARHNVNVYYTRDGDNRLRNTSNEDLNYRGDFADSVGATQFISIHCNAFNDERANGFEVFSSSAGGERTIMANVIHDVFMEEFRGQINSRGIKHALFRVLIRPKAPANLVELGFLTNQKDEKFILDNIDKIGETIAKGYLKHVGIQWIDEPVSVPEFVNLVWGNINERVGDLQRLLNQLNFGLTVDNSFGNMTRSVVIKFQNSYGLPNNGVVDLATWNRILYEVERRNEQLANRIVIKFGTVSASVGTLQTMLAKFGYKLVVDRSFGFNTLKAVNDFQIKYNLVVTKDVNEITWNKIIEESGKIVETPYIYKQLGSTHYVELNPLDIKLHMENTTGARIALKNFMNASFVWWSDYPKNTQPFPTSMLVYDGKTINNKQPNGYPWQAKPHYPTGAPTPTFIIYKDGRVTVENKNCFTVFEASKIHLAVSGIEISPTLKNTGFHPYVSFNSVAYKTNSIAIGYNPTSKKVVLAYHPSANAGTMGRIMTQLGCVPSIRLDSGGSASFGVNSKKIRGSGRWMSAWLTW